jgi:UDPglucose--hexose-1-phosphate uridylyltransferase
MNGHPHRRFNPLVGRWLLVSPHRTQRPWQGKQERKDEAGRPQYDAECYLCPGNERANGEKNPAYTSTFVFANDFAALMPESALPPASAGAEDTADELLHAQRVAGTCRVICFSPRHDLSLPELPDSAVDRVIGVWQEQIAELGEQYEWVQVFENKGAIMGCSNPHPHGQIWASDSLPHEAACEDREQRQYYQKHRAPMLVRYAALESKLEERVIAENEGWIAVVPFWAAWPYEALLLPKRHVRRLTDLEFSERAALVDILKRLLVRYDNLFETTFPYSMGWHGAPFSEGDPKHWQLHAHFYPPLLRSATVRKFMVGYEMFGEPQRDITAEAAASALRNLSEVHYKAAAQKRPR